MPKRSNEFQRLIKVIYDAMAGVEGGSVTESAMLREPDGTAREIDILIETSSHSHTLRIAVECRDRSRKGDVEWIDGLLGKYRNLDIQKIIAVSRSGFSRAAEAKARAGGIETRLLPQCIEADWSNEFVKLGLGQLKILPRPQSVAFELDPTREAAVTLLPTFENREGRQLGSIEWLLLDCYNKDILPKIKEFIDKDFLPACRVLADLKQKLELTIPIDIVNIFVRAADGSVYELKKMTYLVLMEGEIMPSEVHHYKYGDKTCASVATLESQEATHRFRIVQIAGSSQFNVNVEKIGESLHNRDLNTDSR
ncbi:restriction endonuclease [Nitrosospira briensis]|uniref:restriction endonuclease n=1 Tax=Nitrosospira briensis TaxID=35799 RepID=UPI0008E1E905|nr:restriction endonuclease [Nitrosospira briensis]SFO38501.1 Restriction endonuclease [Nitrosospira briensis]